jgi:hypothetical protein
MERASIASLRFVQTTVAYHLVFVFFFFFFLRYVVRARGCVRNVNYYAPNTTCRIPVTNPCSRALGCGLPVFHLPPVVYSCLIVTPRPAHCAQYIPASRAKLQQSLFDTACLLHSQRIAGLYKPHSQTLSNFSQCLAGSCCATLTDCRAPPGRTSQTA